ncbi:MAG: GNAT family N-acetyltransferase [Oscillatoriales cyanobacterium]|nr:MAG: GNAT family N-acetyltransferase [Oscillatoriales cyanobacterium]
MSQVDRPLPAGWLRRGSRADRPLLVAQLQATYQELSPHPIAPEAIAATLDRLLSDETPLWWVQPPQAPEPIAGLWLGWAIDPQTGARRAQLLWIWVCPEARRQGIATTLLRQAEAFARQAGCDRLGLQVDAHNPGAIAFYESLGYATQSIELVKSLTAP